MKNQQKASPLMVILAAIFVMFMFNAPKSETTEPTEPQVTETQMVEETEAK